MEPSAPIAPRLNKGPPSSAINPDNGGPFVQVTTINQLRDTAMTPPDVTMSTPTLGARRVRETDEDLASAAKLPHNEVEKVVCALPIAVPHLSLTDLYNLPPFCANPDLQKIVSGLDFEEGPEEELEGPPTRHIKVFAQWMDVVCTYEGSLLPETIPTFQKLIKICFEDALNGNYANANLFFNALNQGLSTPLVAPLIVQLVNRLGARTHEIAKPPLLTNEFPVIQKPVGRFRLRMHLSAFFNSLSRLNPMPAPQIQYSTSRNWIASKTSSIRTLTDFLQFLHFLGDWTRLSNPQDNILRALRLFLNREGTLDELLSHFVEACIDAPYTSYAGPESFEYHDLQYCELFYLLAFIAQTIPFQLSIKAQMKLIDSIEKKNFERVPPDSEEFRDKCHTLDWIERLRRNLGSSFLEQEDGLPPHRITSQKCVLFLRHWISRKLHLTKRRDLYISSFLKMIFLYLEESDDPSSLAELFIEIIGFEKEHREYVHEVVDVLMDLLLHNHSPAHYHDSDKMKIITAVRTDPETYSQVIQFFGIKHFSPDPKGYPRGRGLLTYHKPKKTG